MKPTKLSEKHIALGAKMAAFAGYNMPISYTSIKEEHQCVRKGIGVFDVSHMGEFIIRGKQALDLIQQISSNDASVLEIGHAQYTCIPNKNGGIVDDMLVYRLDEDQCSEGERAYMLVVNASNIEKDWNWISNENTFDTKMINISEMTSLLAVQGPKAKKVLQKLTDINLSSIEYYHFTKGSIAGLDNVIISATGYTGSGGFELYVSNDKVAALWDAIFEAGKEEEIQAIGLGARDTLRLEMGFCLYGNDIDDKTSPIEAGLSWITKTNKESFNSKEIFLAQKTEGVKKKLVAFKIEDRRVPRQGYTIHDEDEHEIGVVTSGTQSPSLDIPIGLGYVPKKFSKTGTSLRIKAGKKYLPAIVQKLPFYKEAKE